MKSMQKYDFAYFNLYVFLREQTEPNGTKHSWNLIFS